MATDTIHLKSIFKGLKVCIDGGEMESMALMQGRQPRVKRPAVYIAFRATEATVEQLASNPEVASWRNFKTPTGKIGRAHV